MAKLVGAPACCGSSNPDISQKYKMGDKSKKDWPTHSSPHKKIEKKNSFVNSSFCRNQPDQKAPTAIIIIELSSEVKRSQQRRQQSQADQNRRR
jgi:hypothetical protein